MNRWIRDLVDSSTSLSFGRWMSFIVSSVVLIWDTCNLIFLWWWNLHRLGPGVPPVPILPSGVELVSQMTFMTAFYGLNKAHDILTATNEDCATTENKNGVHG